jgi:peptidoglycan hydrolase-like protein with peptidoglycan-binding domain
MTRTLLITGAVAVVLGGVAAGVLLTRGSAAGGPAVSTALPPATAKVIRTTLVETKTESGTLGYGEPVPVRAAERGILTWIAPVGTTVTRGEPLFRVDERPVVALYGSLPLYRPLAVSVQGRDVWQLERNLAALGYRGFRVDETYDAATAAAVRAWQAKLGLPATGGVEPGELVFTPGRVRIAEQTARVGDPVGGEPGAGGGSVLSYTGTSRLVTVELEVADGSLAVKGRTVTVTLPGGRTVKGTISQVGAVATAQAATGQAGSSDQGAPPAGASSTAANAVISVTVTIRDQKALGSLQAAPVDVDFVSGTRNDVLAVPVAALLALTKGGFGVQIVAGPTTRIVPVQTGLFANGQVEVSGKGIAAGVKVGVAGE